MNQITHEALCLKSKTVTEFPLKQKCVHRWTFSIRCIDVSIISFKIFWHSQAMNWNQFWNVIMANWKRYSCSYSLNTNKSTVRIPFTFLNCQCSKYVENYDERNVYMHLSCLVCKLHKMHQLHYEICFKFPNWKADSLESDSKFSIFRPKINFLL